MISERDDSHESEEDVTPGAPPQQRSRRTETDAALMRCDRHTLYQMKGPTNRSTQEYIQDPPHHDDLPASLSHAVDSYKSLQRTTEPIVPSQSYWRACASGSPSTAARVEYMVGQQAAVASARPSVYPAASASPTRTGDMLGRTRLADPNASTGSTVTNSDHLSNVRQPYGSRLREQSEAGLACQEHEGVENAAAGHGPRAGWMDDGHSDDELPDTPRRRHRDMFLGTGGR